MRLIGHLPAEPDARRFVDYLLTRGIAAHAEENTAGAWELWVEDDDRLDAALTELRQYQASPADARYDASADAAALRKQQEQAAEKRRRNFRDVRTTVLTGSTTAATPATFVIIGLAVVVYLLTVYGGTPGDTAFLGLLFDDPNAPHTIAPRLAMFNGILHGQVWRLITPAFLHGSPLHIIFNMLWMLDLGRRIEPTKGTVKFVGLVLMVAMLSNLAEAGWAIASPWNPSHHTIFLGMSGVVSGLFGYAWMCGHFRPYERVGVTQYETGLMLGWLVICSIGFVGPIANAAHWGGLAFGMAIGAAPSLVRKRR